MRNKSKLRFGGLTIEGTPFTPIEEENADVVGVEDTVDVFVDVVDEEAEAADATDGVSGGGRLVDCFSSSSNKDRSISSVTLRVDIFPSRSPRSSIKLTCGMRKRQSISCLISKQKFKTF